MLLEKFRFSLFLLTFLTPKGLPHEVQINLPDKARSALRLELPQTKHLLDTILENHSRKVSRNDNGVLILLEYPKRLVEINLYKTSSFSFKKIVAPL